MSEQSRNPGGPLGGRRKPRAPRQPKTGASRRFVARPKDADRVDDLIPTDGSASVESVVPSAGDSSRSAVKVAGRIIGRVDTGRAGEIGLVAGAPWTAELADQTQREIGIDAARQAALRMLAAAGKTRASLRTALAKKGHAGEAAKAAVDRLAAAGLLDDRAVAEAAARSALSGRGIGTRGLVNKLRAKGVEKDVSESVAKEALAGRDEREDAFKEAQRALRTLSASLDRMTRRRRLSARLARRGFSPDVISDAVERALRMRTTEKGGAADGKNQRQGGSDGKEDGLTRRETGGRTERRTGPLKGRNGPVESRSGNVEGREDNQTSRSGTEEDGLTRRGSTRSSLGRTPITRTPINRRQGGPSNEPGNGPGNEPGNGPGKGPGRGPRGTPRRGRGGPGL